MNRSLLVGFLAIILLLGLYFFVTTDERAVDVPNYDRNREEVNAPQEPSTQGKLNIDAICEGALAYMTFPDGESAATFVAECKEGKYPEVIEQFKRDNGLDGATI